MNGQMKSFRPASLTGPFFKEDIPGVLIDYKGLTSFARSKGKRVCDLTDTEKNQFIIDADMDTIRQLAIK